MLGIATVVHDIDGETMLSRSGEYIDAATFERRTRELRVTASFFKSAGLAKVAGSGAHAERFIKSPQKKLSLESDRNFFRLPPVRLE